MAAAIRKVERAAIRNPGLGSIISIMATGPRAILRMVSLLGQFTQTFWRPSKAWARVRASVNSTEAPEGRPRARRVTLAPVPSSARER